MPSALTELEVDEVSLVPKGANQMAKVALFKRDSGEEKTMGEKFVALFKSWFGSDEVQAVFKADEKLPVACDHTGLMKADGDGYATCPKCGEKIQMKGKEKDMTDETKKAADEVAKALSQDIEEIKKALDVVNAEKAELAKQLKTEQDARATREFVEKASKYARVGMNASDLGALLKTVSEKCGADTLASVEKLVKGANEISRLSLLSEIGKSSSRPIDSPTGRLEVIAKEMMAKDPKLTLEKAITTAATLNPKLADETRAEPAN